MLYLIGEGLDANPLVELIREKGFQTELVPPENYRRISRKDDAIQLAGEPVIWFQSGAPYKVMAWDVQKQNAPVFRALRRLSAEPQDIRGLGGQTQVLELLASAHLASQDPEGEWTLAPKHRGKS